METDFTTLNQYLTTDYIEFESFIDEELDEEELDKYFIKCEQEYIIWFAELWHSVKCHLNTRISYVLMENNSGRSFDLNSMKWVNDAFENIDLKENFFQENSVFRKEDYVFIK